MGFVKMKKKIGLVIFGQSTECGKANIKDMAAIPQAYGSLRNPAIKSGLPGIVSMVQNTVDSRWYFEGSPWCKFYDEMYDYGYDFHMMNASIGSMSFFTDAVAYPRNRRDPQENNANYFRQRRAAGLYGPTDIGCAGTLTVQNGYVFECTTGSEVIAFLDNAGAKIINSFGDVLPNRLDYMYNPTASKKACGSSGPVWTGATTIGSTVTDGAVVWTNIGSAASLGYTLNTAHQPKSIDAPGFDPMGIVRRALRMAQNLRAHGCERVIVLLQNGQSDAGATSQANYQTSLQYLTQFFRGLGFEVAIGLSTYGRGAGGTPALAAGYTALSAAVTAALATFSADTGVHAGADLVSLMGTTEGSGGLSFNFGPYPGSGGPYDGVHRDAASDIVVGGHIADAFRAFLPDRS